MIELTTCLHRHISRGRPSKALFKPLLGVAFAALFVVLCGAPARAQAAANNICKKNGLQPNRENLNGLWELSYSAGTTRHVTRLAIERNAGASVTEYYDTRLRRKRRIRQIHVLCQAKVGVVILGYEPTDIDNGDKGSNLTYSADNFVISQQPDGTVVAFNRDDAGSLAEIDIKFVKELSDQ